MFKKYRVELPECYVRCPFHSGEIYFTDICCRGKDHIVTLMYENLPDIYVFGQLLLLQQSAAHRRIPGLPTRISLLLATLFQHTCAHF